MKPESYKMLSLDGIMIDLFCFAFGNFCAVFHHRKLNIFQLKMFFQLKKKQAWLELIPWKYKKECSTF